MYMVNKFFLSHSLKLFFYVFTFFSKSKKIHDVTFFARVVSKDDCMPICYIYYADNPSDFSMCHISYLTRPPARC